MRVGWWGYSGSCVVILSACFLSCDTGGEEGGAIGAVENGTKARRASFLVDPC